MKAKKYWNLAVVALVIVGLGVTNFLAYLSRQPALPSGLRMVLPFRKVGRFTRPVILLYPHVFSYDANQDQPGVLGLSCLDGSYDGQIYTRLLVEKREIPFGVDHWDGFIAVKPDNSAFYIGTERQLVEFGRDLHIKRRIPISQFEFGLNGLEFEFGGTAVASNERLWFSVNKLDEGSTNWEKTYTTFLVQWCTEEPPSSRLTTDIQTSGGFDLGGLAVDADARKVFSFHPANVTETFNFSTGQAQTASFGNIGFIDFDKEFGSLLSQTSLQAYSVKPIIEKINKETGVKTVVTKGLSAVWGFDGYVYFSNGRKELWRCKADGSSREPVYVASSGNNIDIQAHYYPPKMSSDRTLAAFNYSYSDDTGKAVIGMVLLDLKNKEYIEVPEYNMQYNQMAWLVGSDVTPEHSESQITE